MYIRKWLPSCYGSQGGLGCIVNIRRMQSLPIPTASAAAAAADEVMPADGAGAIQSGGLAMSGEARGKHVFSHSPTTCSL